MKTDSSIHHAEQWDMVIEPKVSLLNLNIKEVWRYRDLMWLFVKRDFSAQYKQTILGPLWHIIQPLFTTLMFLLVFRYIANIDTDGIKPLLFYMSGITIWNYFSNCIISTSNTFVANAGIFGKVYFPRLILPLSVVISNVVRFIIQFGLLIILMTWYHFHGYKINAGGHLLLIPLLVLMMSGIGLGLGIIVSSLTTKYRDLAVLIGFTVQLLMFITPIAYPFSFLKDKSYASWMKWNPLTPIVEAFRYSLFGKGTFDAAGLLYSSIVVVALFLFGVLIFNKVERTFMDTV